VSFSLIFRKDGKSFTAIFIRRRTRKKRDEFQSNIAIPSLVEIVVIRFVIIDIP
jgi:hypothetical protein